MTRYWFGIICGGIALLTSDGVEGALVEYTIRFSQAQNHYADVELRCETEGKQQFELMMPTWTPGSYLIREYARHV